MNTPLNANNMRRAENIIESIGTGQQYQTAKIKRIKREDGLLEREEFDEEKIILTEDNRQILFG